MAHSKLRSVIVIPARLRSTRLPKKLLLADTGQTLLEHTYRAASQSRLAEEVIVAADDQEIVSCVNDFGGKVVLTRADHPSGSSRVAEVAESLNGFDVVVNVQGDEPELSGESIDRAIELLAESSDSVVSTLACPIRDRQVLDDPAAVKVVFDRSGKAMYFSRSPVPFVREWSDGLLQSNPPKFFLHIGLYAYRRDFLSTFVNLPAADCEQLESLEQLRILDSGYGIQVGVVDHHAAGIDTPEDYQAFVSRHVC